MSPRSIKVFPRIGKGLKVSLRSGNEVTFGLSKYKVVFYDIFVVVFFVIFKSKQYLINVNRSPMRFPLKKRTIFATMHAAIQ